MPSLPLFPLATVAVPEGLLPLVIFEPRYRALLADLLRLPDEDRIFGVVAIRRGHEVGQGRAEQLYGVGTAVRVVSVYPMPAGIRVGCVGVQRFRLDARVPGTDYLVGEVTWLDEEPGDVSALAFLSRQVREGYSAYGRLVGLPPLETTVVDGSAAPVDEAARSESDQAATLAYAVLDRLHLPLPERQSVLAAPTTSERLRLLAGLLRRETGLAGRLRTRPVMPPYAGGSLN